MSRSTVFISLSFFILLFSVKSYSDCGSVPFYSPILHATDGLIQVSIASGKTYEKQKMVNFDPLKVSVFEPKQRAIILWNGKEQILLLSTDQRATEQSAILEVIPLPSEPSIKLGSFETFEKAQRLVVKNRMWAFASGSMSPGSVPKNENAAKITFEKRMGAHDLTVANVVDKENFSSFINNYLKEKYKVEKVPIKDAFLDIIDSYIEQDIKWFAFDVIYLDKKNQSREPIEYRFKTDEVFYPMRISTLEKGKTEVEMLVFTKFGLTDYSELEYFNPKMKDSLRIALQEFDKVNEDWNGFFGDIQNHISMDHWVIKGDISKYKRDIRVR